VVELRFHIALSVPEVLRLELDELGYVYLRWAGWMTPLSYHKVLPLVICVHPLVVCLLSDALMTVVKQVHIERVCIHLLEDGFDLFESVSLRPGGLTKCI